jgi:7-cyano-7-deazaguanine synthase
MAQVDVCALVSGGVDSAVLAWHLARDGTVVQPIYVRTGMVWEEVELRHLCSYLDALGLASLRAVKSLSFPLGDVYESHWSVGGVGRPGYDAPDEAVYLPGRNLILASKVAIYCALNGIERIATGLLAGNPFPDATDAFFDSLAKTLTLGLGARITIDRPFASMRKREVVSLGSALPLELTFSCINPVGENHCGDCNKCAERQQGFNEASVLDRTVYARQPTTEKAG